MKRNRKPLPIPQHEFGFTPQAFNLFAEPGTDGERLSRELTETQRRRRLAEQAQAALFVQSATPLSP